MTRFDRTLEPFVVVILFAVIFIATLFTVR
jgi:hypothetical protein